MSDEIDQHEVRMQHLEALREDGRDPFGIHEYERSHTAAEIVCRFDEFEGTDVSVGGRLMASRGHGKSAFADLRDACGEIQIYAQFDKLGQQDYEAFQKLDVGDIIGVHGEVFKTRTEEVTVRVSEYELLAKALRPLPEKFHGLQDTEARYRHRYLDLLMNEETREVFRTRAQILKATRQFFYQRDFDEVETPILQNIYGGANARPFMTHHNALDIDLYMRIAPELYLKRLVIGGMERVFEIGKVFRNEGVDRQHNPEFTILETYEAYADYEQMMTLTEDLLQFIASEAIGSLEFTFGNHDIDLSAPWRRVNLYDAVQKATGIDFADIETDKQAREACSHLDLDDIDNATYPELLDKTFEQYVQPELIQPTFVRDYPTVISPLAKRKPEKPSITARFEPFIAGQECGNAFSELNDPLDQRQRFEQQVAAREHDDEAHPMDEDYLEALEYGLPPTGGMGLGMDRIVMLLTDRANIREVVLFPTLRPKTQ